MWNANGLFVIHLQYLNMIMTCERPFHVLPPFCIGTGAVSLACAGTNLILILLNPKSKLSDLLCDFFLAESAGMGIVSVLQIRDAMVAADGISHEGTKNMDR